MDEKRRINPVRILIAFLAVMIVINLISTMRAANNITYYELRQLFTQEKVEEFSITETKLTAKLKDGSQATCELYDFDLFYDDMNELVQQQAAAGIIKNYDYWADHSTNWLEILLPYVVMIVGFFLLYGLLVE